MIGFFQHIFVCSAGEFHFSDMISDDNWQRFTIHPPYNFCTTRGKVEIVSRPGLGNSAFGRPHFGPVGPGVGLKEEDVPAVLGRFHKSHGGLDGGVAGVDKDHDLVPLPHEVDHLVVTDLIHVLPLLALVFPAHQVSGH